MENLTGNQIWVQKKSKCFLKYIEFYKLKEILTGNQIRVQKESKSF